MHRIKINKAKVALFLVVVALCVLWLVPLYFIILTSLKTHVDYITYPFWSFPKDFALIKNIKYIISETYLVKTFLNSLFYATVASAISIFLSSLASYGIAKLKLKGSFTIFIIIWSGMIFPIQIYLIPLYKAYLMTNLYNTYMGMLLIYVAITIPFCVFVFRNYFLSLPEDFQEAAKIDGCNRFQIYLRMIIPNSLSPIVVLFLFQGSFIWNDLVLGMTLSSTQDVRPVMQSLASLSSFYSARNTPVVMVGSLLVSLPIIILYFSLQKYFIQGLSIQASGE